MSLNVFTFTGRLGADAETTYTQGGTAIWSARVAVDYGLGDKKGTSWITAKAIGKHAESLSKMEFPKGSKIGGTGELQVREYDKRDGGKGVAVECLVDRVDLPSREGSQSGNGTPRRNAPQPQRRDAPQDSPAFDDAGGDPFGDNIPFATNRGTF